MLYVKCSCMYKTSGNFVSLIYSCIHLEKAGMKTQKERKGFIYIYIYICIYMYVYVDKLFASYIYIYIYINR